METFARKCSATGIGMNRGWVTHDFEYFLLEDDAHNWCKANGFEDIEDAFLQDAIYYTEWQDDDHEWQVINGQLICIILKLFHKSKD